MGRLVIRNHLLVCGNVSWIVLDMQPFDGRLGSCGPLSDSQGTGHGEQNGKVFFHSPSQGSAPLPQGE